MSNYYQKTLNPKTGKMVKALHRNKGEYYIIVFPDGMQEYTKEDYEKLIKYSQKKYGKK